MLYHLRRKDREISEETELFEIVEKGKYAVIALCSADEPYIVTLSYGFKKDDDILYFHCANEGKKLDFIRENNRACLTIIEDDGYIQNKCDHSYRTVVIRGKITEVHDKKEKDEAIILMINQLEKENPEKGMKKLNKENPFYTNLKILRLEIEAISGKAKKPKSDD
jgi:uncharacterized protein